MKGKYEIVVKNNRLHYEFEIKRNITILRGDSATGKTTLIRQLVTDMDMAMKIVLSGTDSLGFMFTKDEALYDRCIMCHTTFIPYR